MTPSQARASSSQLEDAASAFRTSLPSKVRTGLSIAPFTSLRLGGPAAIFVEVQEMEDLRRTSDLLAQHLLPVLVVGRGTNLLVSDRGFEGVVLRLGKGFEWIRSSSRVPSRRPATSIEAGGAAQLPRVANWAARRSLTGLEFALAIPATVGGGVWMNAGAHSSCLSEVLEEVTIYRLLPEDRGNLPNVRDARDPWDGLAVRRGGDLGMRYRESALAEGDLVCSARLRLAIGERKEIAEKMEQFRRHRARTQPSHAPNAGSIFKNPPGGSAGRLIEEAGLKGHRVGGAEVSVKHANFFLAHPGATAQDVYDLMADVQARVAEASGVLLLPEVRIAGSFQPAIPLRLAGRAP
ncbi:MAG: UDP-N-acetylmuramate dehydrogenase [Actinomycetota bacterium]